MDLNTTFTIYTQLLQKKYAKSQEGLEQYDIRNKDTNIEYEIRFRNINKIKFEEIHKRLMMAGFVTQNEDYYLKIINYINSVRCEINDITNIKEYCKQNILPDSTKYIMKEKFKEFEPFDNEDYDFRVSIQKEISLREMDVNVKQIMKTWKAMDKSYRYMNRISLIHPDMPGVVVDLSVVKSAKKDRQLLKEKEFSLSKLFETPEEYEVEIELKPESMAKEYIVELLKNLKTTIKYVCSGVQSSNFPISYGIQHTIAYEYYTLINQRNRGNGSAAESRAAEAKSELVDIRRFVPNSSMFIGPSSYTLQKINLIDDPTNATPCILKDFCVTDKADGERKMLFISESGKIYFITSGMQVQYTGAFCRTPELRGLLLDGEHILYDKKKKYLNLYAAFDIYFISGRSVRSLPFVTEKINRYHLLNDKVALLSRTIEYETKEHVRIEAKKFAVSTPDVSIQECCEHLFSAMPSFPYTIDGLIFTSNILGVGMESPEDKKVKNYKYTWKHSFKWKPPEFNTIDFLVKTKKTYGNKDEVKNVFSTDTQSVEEFKILNLYIGWDDTTHGYSNPQEMLFRGEFPTPHSERKGLKPELFSPTSPYDPNAHISYVQVKHDSSGQANMFTEDNEVIESDTIVEFKYEFNDNPMMCWKPLRVRYDKTAEYKNTNSIFGNAFHVANSNWSTIHNPITREMLVDKELKLTMDDIEDKEVYYNKKAGPSKTVNLRDFHNMYVKKLLIETVSGPEKVLIDFAVGKAGDLQKWIHSRLKFVLGIDISVDNIHNKKDGACARYIGTKQNKKDIPDALFVVGDSSRLIIQALTKQEPLAEEKDDEVTKFVLNQVLGKGKADEKYGKFVSKQFGVASRLFDVASIQFALHYMFENKYTLHNFLKNVSDLVKVNGYFVGTCYDGAKIFRMLEDTDENDTKDIYVDGKKIWSVIKKYDNVEFDDSLGYKIGVYQETINKVFDEYLVNFRLLIEVLQQYGFELASPNELPPIGDFSDLYRRMKTDRTYKIEMSEEEKQISFLNNYFMFKKIRSVDTDMVHQHFTQEREEPKFMISRPIRMNKKIVLQTK
jgi:hypothetical protein